MDPSVNAMVDYIIIAVVACIVGAIVFYLIRAKKRGETCIGCPYAKQCGGKCGGGCADQSGDKAKTKK